jgi:hypothetical protein
MILGQYMPVYRGLILRIRSQLTQKFRARQHDQLCEQVLVGGGGVPGEIWRKGREGGGVRVVLSTWSI